MAERRKLTPDEQAAAARFDSALMASPHSPESLSAALGITPAAVGHWRRGEIAIPLRRVAHAAQLLSIDPAAISIEWASAVTPYLRNSPSQPLGLDAVKLATSIAALRQVASRNGLEYDPETHPNETVAAYELACALPATPTTADVIDFGARVADLLRKRREGVGNGGQGADEQAGVGHRGRSKAKG